jgi:prepilin signal peptidase PulO-like enzyme (type II secretory pathway)
MWLVATVILMALLVYDLRWLLLPNRLVYPLTLLAASFVAFQAVALQNWTVLLHALLGAIVLSGLFWSLFQISQGRWIGGGDVKIAVGLGLLAGSAQQSLLLLFIASLLGTLYGLPILIRKRPSHKVPFGPFLITATVIVVLWGQAAADWYLRTAGL